MSPRGPDLDRVLLALVCLGALIVGALAVRRIVEGPSGTMDPESGGGDQIAVVVLVSSTCASCRRIQRGTLAEMMDSIGARSTAEGLEAHLVGVAVDQSWETGVEFLSGLGEFDEVIAGRRWLNNGMVMFVHRDLPGPESVPQILVLRRNVSRDEGLTNVADDQLLLRRTGLDELWRWQERGFPLPTIGVSSAGAGQ